MNYNIIAHLSEFIGQTVTVFTTSGGPSGCGFTGVLLFVNPCYIRLSTQQGTPPTSPLAENICPKFAADTQGQGTGCHKPKPIPHFVIGSVCDIPVDKIASFCHNAI
ncbi:hypothetical protein I5677_00645 [Mobilitalea sibirica]|uniref:Uncharacterized protein n=1 Tax=Mobilitalea sibirica TaxID=1462919 RepID=A0A8J7H7E7_9FIRM|nr:hypothetical protein [Mobilitalea sibirica]MBH1939395.1 hypothetical protein [Mobilitalea sibirica]